jgi:hypothetical protein
MMLPGGQAIVMEEVVCTRVYSRYESSADAYYCGLSIVDDLQSIIVT